MMIIVIMIIIIIMTIYIYIYREREREIYIYIYICIKGTVIPRPNQMFCVNAQDQIGNLPRNPAKVPKHPESTAAK